MLPDGRTFSGALRSRGVSRRRFMEFCGAMVATLALPTRYVAKVADALGRVFEIVLVRHSRAVWQQNNTKSRDKGAMPEC